MNKQLEMFLMGAQSADRKGYEKYMAVSQFPVDKQMTPFKEA